MGKAVERGDCGDARLLVGMQQRAMSCVEPQLGEQRCRQQADGLDAAQVKRAFPGADGQAQLGDARRIVEPLVQKRQYRPRDAGALCNGSMTWRTESCRG
jgi:hypothetical protein